MAGGRAAVQLSDLVKLGARLEILASGFTYTEGPVWVRRWECVLFHDIPADTRYRWTADRGVTVEQHPTGKANGMAVDATGRILVCESGANRVVRRELDGRVTVLASHFGDRELNSPNDIAVRNDGDVYFSDPAYGRIPVYGQDRPQDLDFQGVFRIRAGDGALDLVACDCEQPNGLCWSPDSGRLYVNDCEHGSIWVYDVDEARNVSPGRVFREGVGVPCRFADARANNLPSGYVDGMKCDELGHVYVTGPGGILVLDTDGATVGLLELPEDVANFAWGGGDGKDLFVCCRRFLGRIRMNVRGAAIGATE